MYIDNTGTIDYKSADNTIFLHFSPQNHYTNIVVNNQLGSTIWEINIVENLIELSMYGGIWGDITTLEGKVGKGGYLNLYWRKTWDEYFMESENE